MDLRKRDLSSDIPTQKRDMSNTLFSQREKNFLGTVDRGVEDFDYSASPYIPFLTHNHERKEEEKEKRDTNS